MAQKNYVPHNKKSYCSKITTKPYIKYTSFLSNIQTYVSAIIEGYRRRISMSDKPQSDDENMDECMLSIETDPLEKTYGVRVPLITKDKLDKLSRIQKRQLNDELLKTIDRFLYNAQYVPGKNLKSDTLE